VTSLYLDVHVPAAVADQLRRLGVDVLTAREDAAAQLPDAALLKRATALGRLLFTQDIRFKSLAEDWQRTGQPFAGLVFGHQLHGSIGQYVRDLELIAKATQPAEWWCQIEQLPLR
jgi:hypothetical protein